MNQGSGQVRKGAPEKVHLIFKTHLDIGFTDFSARVCQHYHDHFIPMAIATAEHFWREDPETPKFIWTTGAWLIYEQLEQGTPESRRKLENAIRKGIISWHALPFTTHTELLSPELFKAGLSYSRLLDLRFGQKTTGAKMTDVPGHTRGLVPLMAQAGIRFLHIGVNPASTPPDVPPIFRWRAPDGAEIVVVYQNDYGSTFFPDGANEGIGFAHTNDNAGPQSIAQSVEAHRLISLQNPGANIAASTLTDFGNVLWTMRSNFPIVTAEIGDSWIHGVGSAPQKVSRYLGLRRLYGTWARTGLTPKRQEMGRRLCMVAEHTWGADIKTFLREETAWDRSEFEHARRSNPRFALTEHSWLEQEALIDVAISGLEPNDQADAKRAAAPIVAQASDLDVSKCRLLDVGRGQLEFDTNTGGLQGIRFPNALRLFCGDGPMTKLSYESYDAGDYQNYLNSYLTQEVYWSLQDQGKPGLENAKTASSAVFQAEWLGAAVDTDGHAVVKYRFEGCATDDLGAPRGLEMRCRFTSDDRLEITVLFFNKPANRMPEASFLTFAPAVDPSSWRFSKLGDDIDPRDVVQNGNRQLHAVESVSCRDQNGRRVGVTPLDSVLVGPAGAPFLPFFKGDISMEKGVHFCLHNNKWGTNFPMWCEGNLVFRFELILSPDS